MTPGSCVPPHRRQGLLCLMLFFRVLLAPKPAPKGEAKAKAMAKAKAKAKFYQRPPKGAKW